MAMRPCDKCLDNIWTFEKVDGYVIATCEMCSHTVEWLPKPKKGLSNGSKCKSCTGSLQLKVSPFKRAKLDKPYFYSHTLRCDKCGKRYNSEKHKIINKHIVDNKKE